MAAFGIMHHRHLDMCNDERNPGFCELMEVMWHYGLQKSDIYKYVHKICPHSSDDSDDEYVANEVEAGEIPGFFELSEIMWQYGLERYEITSYLLYINVAEMYD